MQIAAACLPADSQCLPAKLEIRLLGPLLVHAKGAPVTRFRTSRVRTLLAFLALQVDVPVERSLLQELLWPSQDTTDDMRQTLSRLRQVLQQADLGALLCTGRQLIWLASSPELYTDVSELRRHLQQWQGHCSKQTLLCSDCARALHQALSLYRGDLGLDVDLHYSDELARWYRTQKDALRQELSRAQHALIAHQLQSRDLRDLERGLERLLELDPFDEQAVRLRMSLLNSAGASAQALNFYSSWQRRLRDELGTTPEAETRALASGLTHGAEAVPSTRSVPDVQCSPSPLRLLSPPSSPAPSLPRDPNTAACLELLARSDCRLLTLCTGAFPAQSWVQILLDQLRVEYRERYRQLRIEPNVLPGAYAQRLHSVLQHCYTIRPPLNPLGASHTDTASATPPPPTLAPSPLVLVQTVADTAQIDAQALQEVLLMYPQLKVISLVPRRLRLRAEHHFMPVSGVVSGSSPLKAGLQTSA